MSLIRRCDICGFEAETQFGVKLNWIKFTSSKSSSQDSGKKYDVCTTCMCSIRNILDSINDGELKIDEDFYTDITTVGRVLNKILEAENQ